MKKGKKKIPTPTQQKIMLRLWKKEGSRFIWADPDGVTVHEEEFDITPTQPKKKPTPKKT